MVVFTNATQNLQNVGVAFSFLVSLNDLLHSNCRISLQFFSWNSWQLHSLLEIQFSTMKSYYYFRCLVCALLLPNKQSRLLLIFWTLVPQILSKARFLWIMSCKNFANSIGSLACYSVSKWPGFTCSCTPLLQKSVPLGTSIQCHAWIWAHYSASGYWDARAAASQYYARKGFPGIKPGRPLAMNK